LAELAAVVAWKIVIVDDDPDVLSITSLVLRRFEALGQSVRLLQCQSGLEARELLSKEHGVAVLITDVVMEEDDAGLKLVQWARQQPHLANTRIVIRTGQPGMAPEADVLEGLDINDYWTKQDLSSRRMQTLLTGLIRSYRDLEKRTKDQEDTLRTLQEKRAELQESVRNESLFHAVSVSLSAGTLLIQGNQVLHFNPRAKQLLGSFVGQAIERVEDLPPPLNSSPPPSTGELSQTDSTQTKWLSFQTRPVTQKHLEGHLVTLTDITDRKMGELNRLRAEREVLRTQHLEQVGLLASGVAHDLNNLMTIIIGTSDYLQEMAEDKEQASGLADIQEACTAATELAQQMMLYGSGGEVVRKVQDICTLVEDAISLWANEARRTRVDIDFSGPKEGGIHVEVANSQIQQLIGNLASNALRAMPNGGSLCVRLFECMLDRTKLSEATFNSTVEAGRFALLTFQDQGPGIQPETLQHIFDPFYTTHKAGRGLGLATIQGIAARLGAAIFVESELGKGTTFKIAMPVSDTSSELRVSEYPEHPESTLRILVLDDVALVRRQICRILTRRGHEVVEAATAKEAIEAMSGHFDGAVVDFMLEFTTGDVALQELRKIRPDLPAVLCTGYIDPDSVQKADDFSEVVHKPFSSADLIEAVERSVAARVKPNEG
jgi:signal transduction histidine kinase/response regulator RpfG family c-di-GMP phosphodiesterase